ncbi:MAG: iron ABC transporter permease [Burkholderiaceae bacterium]|nr:iron ABC transporter permease [Burkholderiaceae bacterium]
MNVATDHWATPGPLPARRLAARLALSALALALTVAVVLALGIGAYRITAPDVLRILLALATGDAADDQATAVLSTIRAPRVLLAGLTGAGLAVAGTLTQGLFRNPLADPALVGVSAGAALAAAAVIVLGNAVVPASMRSDALGPYVLPIAAFAGSLTVTALVYRIGRAHGVLSLPLTLLAGIAINAIAMAGVGLLIFVATDEALRSLTFWNLGSLAAGTWRVVLPVAPLVLLAIAWAWRLAPAFNVLALGEARAEYMGVDVDRLKRQAIVLTALATGALVAVTGVIGFVGLVAPHLVRLACGPDHRVVLPGAALLGALLVVLADLLARTIVVPAELPLGIVTALAGGPFFLFLLLRTRWTKGV